MTIVLGDKNKTIVTQKLLKGDDGYTPIKGVDYFTEEEINAIIEQIGTGGVDLSNYYTKEDIDAELENYASIGYVDDAIPDVSGYALKTEIPDVSAYQTAAQVQELIDTSLSSIGVAEEGEF